MYCRVQLTRPEQWSKHDFRTQRKAASPVYEQISGTTWCNLQSVEQKLCRHRSRQSVGEISRVSTRYYTRWYTLKSVRNLGWQGSNVRGLCSNSHGQENRLICYSSRDVTTPLTSAWSQFPLTISWSCSLRLGFIPTIFFWLTNVEPHLGLSGICFQYFAWILPFILRTRFWTHYRLTHFRRIRTIFQIISLRCGQHFREVWVPRLLLNWRWILSRVITSTSLE